MKSQLRNSLPLTLARWVSPSSARKHRKGTVTGHETSKQGDLWSSWMGRFVSCESSPQSVLKVNGVDMWLGRPFFWRFSSWMRTRQSCHQPFSGSRSLCSFSSQKVGSQLEMVAWSIKRKVFRERILSLRSSLRFLWQLFT
jgi:hypothetical protein